MVQTHIKKPHWNNSPFRLRQRQISYVFHCGAECTLACRNVLIFFYFVCSIYMPPTSLCKAAVDSLNLAWCLWCWSPWFLHKYGWTKLIVVYSLNPDQEKHDFEKVWRQSFSKLKFSILWKRFHLLCAKPKVFIKGVCFLRIAGRKWSWTVLRRCYIITSQAARALHKMIKDKHHQY